MLSGQGWTNKPSRCVECRNKKQQGTVCARVLECYVCVAKKGKGAQGEGEAGRGRGRGGAGPRGGARGGGGGAGGASDKKANNRCFQVSRRFTLCSAGRRATSRSNVPARVSC